MKDKDSLIKLWEDLEDAKWLILGVLIPCWSFLGEHCHNCQRRVPRVHNRTQSPGSAMSTRSRSSYDANSFEAVSVIEINVLIEGSWAPSITTSSISTQHYSHGNFCNKIDQLTARIAHLFHTPLMIEHRHQGILHMSSQSEKDLVRYSTKARH